MTMKRATRVTWEVYKRLGGGEDVHKERAELYEERLREGAPRVYRTGRLGSR